MVNNTTKFQVLRITLQSTLSTDVTKSLQLKGIFLSNVT